MEVEQVEIVQKNRNGVKTSTSSANPIFVTSVTEIELLKQIIDQLTKINERLDQITE